MVCNDDELDLQWDGQPLAHSGFVHASHASFVNSLQAG